jgi:hypothetical protein
MSNEEAPPKSRCAICDRILNATPDSQDLGGDCLRCMALCGDPYAIETLAKLEKQTDE